MCPGAKPNLMDEQKLLKLYMDLTGSNESGARSVFMFLDSPDTTDREEDLKSPERGKSPEAVDEGKGAAKPGARLPLVILAMLMVAAGAAQANGPNSTNGSTDFIYGPISLADAINLALKQNQTILRAQKDVEATEGVVIQTRAIALPKLGLAGDYGAVQGSDIDQFDQGGTNAIKFGATQAWRTQLKLMQSIYEGGRMVSAFRSARLTRERSLLDYQTAVVDIVLLVKVAYYDVLLAQQQIIVQEASVELLSRELADTTKRFDAGTVPRFNVLRAEVEVANARPKLIRARNSFRIAKNNLALLLGFRIPKESFEDIPLNLSGKLEAEPFDIQLPQAIALAMEKRTELRARRKEQALRQEDIVNAKAGYRPSLQAFAGYDAHSPQFGGDLIDQYHGWLAGVQLNWSLFDGFYTRGKVMQARALHDRSIIEVDDAARRIELEVRTAFSNFIEAREVLESQKKVLEQAEEALRLASARFQAGTGTQLDVLSAQTALTDARSTQIEALRDYSVARSRLERSLGLSLPSEQAATPPR
jgi:outer membrane protein